MARYGHTLLFRTWKWSPLVLCRAEVVFSIIPGLTKQLKGLVTWKLLSWIFDAMAFKIQKPAGVPLKMYQNVSHLLHELTWAKYSNLWPQKIDLPNIVNVGLCFSNLHLKDMCRLVSPEGFIMEVKNCFFWKVDSNNQTVNYLITK